MDADIKWLVGDLRLGVRGFRNGKPWTIGVTVGVCMDGTAELQRIDRPLTPSGWKAIGMCLARFGFTHCRFERKLENGMSEWHEVDLARYHKLLAKERGTCTCGLCPIHHEPKPRSVTKRAFTWVEILIALVVLGLVCAIALPGLTPADNLLGAPSTQPATTQPCPGK